MCSRSVQKTLQLHPTKGRRRHFFQLIFIFFRTQAQSASYSKGRQDQPGRAFSKFLATNFFDLGLGNELHWRHFGGQLSDEQLGGLPQQRPPRDRLCQVENGQLQKVRKVYFIIYWYQSASRASKLDENGQEIRGHFFRQLFFSLGSQESGWNQDDHSGEEH